MSGFRQSAPIGALVAALSSVAVLSSWPDERVQAQARAIPLNADGKPDLSGIWQVVVPANANILPHHADRDTPGGLGVTTEIELPYLPSALPKRKENYKNRLTADTEAKCYLPGVPRIMYMPFPFQIFQTPNQISMVFEYVHAMRNVYMNTSHPAGPIEWWMGDSRGRWDGDTLVVDVVHFNADTWFDRTGNYHSENMHVVERYSFLDPDHIIYEATIEDASVFSRPWKMNMILYRHKEPNFQLLDYECYTFNDDDVRPIPPVQ